MQKKRPGEPGREGLLLDVLDAAEINVAGFAKKYGLNATLLRSYINGFKTPSAEREKVIFSYIHELGKEYETAGR